MVQLLYVPASGMWVEDATDLCGPISQRPAGLPVLTSQSALRLSITTSRWVSSSKRSRKSCSTSGLSSSPLRRHPSTERRPWRAYPDAEQGNGRGRWSGNGGRLVLSPAQKLHLVVVLVTNVYDSEDLGRLGVLDHHHVALGVVGLDCHA